MKSSNYVITMTKEFFVNHGRSLDMSLFNVQIDTFFQPFRVSDKTIKILFEAWDKAIASSSIPKNEWIQNGKSAFAINGKIAIPVVLSSYYRVKKRYDIRIPLSESPCVSDDADTTCLFILKGMKKEYLIPYDKLEGSVNLMSGISYAIRDDRPTGEKKWLEIEL